MVNPPRKAAHLSSDVDTITLVLADRTYRGAEGSMGSAMRPITINLPTWMIHQLEESARQNKRSKGTNRSVSALIRHALVESGVLVGDL